MPRPSQISFFYTQQLYKNTPKNLIKRIKAILSYLELGYIVTNVYDDGKYIYVELKNGNAFRRISMKLSIRTVSALYYLNILDSRKFAKYLARYRNKLTKKDYQNWQWYRGHIFYSKYLVEHLR